jgi:hypothetical protein
MKKFIISRILRSILLVLGGLFLSLIFAMFIMYPFMGKPSMPPLLNYLPISTIRLIFL